MGTPRRKGMAAGVITAKTSEMLQADAKPQLIDEIINEELQSMQIFDIPMEELYSAPAKWNEWNRLPEEKLIQLCQSIVEIGQQAPCIVWKIDKAKVLSLYDSGEPDAYGFVGEKYMILSGHNRAFCRRLIGGTVEHSDDEEYRVCPCIVYEEPISEEFIDKAKQIIDDTNYLSRENTPKEIMRAIRKKLEAESNRYKKREVTKVTDSIAKKLNMNEKTVRRYTKLNDDLLPSILNFLYDGNISFNDAMTISDFDSSVQEYLFQNHKNLFTNKREMKRFLKLATSDMSIPEVQEILVAEEKAAKFEKITVSVPIDRIDEFNKMFKEWKKKIGHMSEIGHTFEE